MKDQDYTMDPVSKIPDRPERKPMPENLPKSSDDSFWTPDGERNKIELDKLVRPDMTKHSLVRRGIYAVCVTCPHQHTLALDFEKYDIINGQPVKKPLTTPKKDITIKEKV